MGTLRSVEQLRREHGLDPKQLAEKAGLDERRMLAILHGNWTPSPAERDRVAAVFGIPREQIIWGHTTSVEHLYGHGPQFGRTP
jgi:transcriptional regulator with XRE-family HTH domain